MMQESHAASSRDKYPAESSNYIEWGPSLQALLLGPFFLFYFPETALGPQTATGDPRGVAGEIRLGRGPPLGREGLQDAYGPLGRPCHRSLIRPLTLRPFWAILNHCCH